MTTSQRKRVDELCRAIRVNINDSNSPDECSQWTYAHTFLDTIGFMGKSDAWHFASARMHANEAMRKAANA